MRDWTLQYSLFWASIFNEDFDCPCPDGYEPYAGECRKFTDTPTVQPPEFEALELIEKTYDQYSQNGVKIYDEGYNLDGTGTSTLYTQTSPATFWHNVDSVNHKDYGVMNRTGLWATTYFTDQQIGFATCINTPIEKTYLVGFGVDNYVTIRIDGVDVMKMTPQENANTFRYWHIYPVTIKKGVHVIEIIANNKSSIASIGAEIYNATQAELMATTNKTELEPYLIFSTEDLIGAYTNLGDNGYPIMEDAALVFCYGDPPFYRQLNYFPCLTDIYDGQHQIAASIQGYIYVSSDFGETWVQKLNYGNYQSAAISQYGNYQIVAVYNSGFYISSDWGANWILFSLSKAWQSISMSKTGQYQIAAPYGDFLYLSDDFGETWETVASSKNWSAIAVSFSGQYQTAVPYSDYIYISSDYGATWAVKSDSKGWRAIALSATGQYQTAAGYYFVYTSSDYGLTWTSRLSTKDWYGAAISGTGQYQTVVATNGYIYVSSDYGVTWNTKDSSRNWRSVSVSYSGKYQSAVVYAGYIYISDDYGQTWTQKGISKKYKSIAINKKE